MLLWSPVFILFFVSATTFAFFVTLIGISLATDAVGELAAIAESLLFRAKKVKRRTIATVGSKKREYSVKRMRIGNKKVKADEKDSVEKSLTEIETDGNELKTND